MGMPAGATAGLGWRDRYPLLVAVWESPLVASPSVQLWIPHRTTGAPIVEGVFEQIVEEGHFVGASSSTLPAALRQRIAEEAVYIACLFQELGYFGRCGLDTVLSTPGLCSGSSATPAGAGYRSR